MSVLPSSVQKAIEEFRKLPGVGPKSASRLVYHFLRSPNNDATKLANALLDMDSSVKFCTKCFNVSDSEVCDICNSPIRKNNKLCIVEEPLDIVSFEDAGIYDGYYFVLGGAISPADGITADELRFKELVDRVVELVDGGNAVEIIIATNPNLEGEATAMYIKDLLSKYSSVSMTRLAMGLPTGADLEYADRLTLKRALDGRQSLK
jgi:recombination protein RecR